MKKINRRSFLKVAGIAGITSALAACGETATPASSTDTASSTATESSGATASDPLAIEEGAKLIYWPMWAETEPQGQVISQAIDAFSASTGVEVEINWTGARETRKIIQATMDSGEQVDIFDEALDMLSIQLGEYLLDVTPQFEASVLNGKHNEALLTQAKDYANGALLAIPYQPSGQLILGNKRLINEAGFDTYPQTWDEFTALCDALVANGVFPLTTDDAYLPLLFGTLVTRVVGVDTAYAIADGDFTNPGVLQTAELIQSMVDKGYIDPRAAANVFPSGQQNIADESVAMYLNGTWLPNEIRNQLPEGFEWAGFTLPAATDAGVGTEAIGLSSQAFGITKTCQYPNAAFALITWLTDGEWDSTLAVTSLGIPAANDSEWPVELSEAKVSYDNAEVIVNWAANFERDPNMTATIKTIFAQLISKDIDAAQFAEEFGKIQLA